MYFVDGPNRNLIIIIIWIRVQFRVCPLKALQPGWLIVRFHIF